MNTFELHHGDCLAVLRGMADASVDAIVTDPPYGLSFMGKRWDYDVPSVEVWAECLRVLKPGGHLLAFAGTRTQHRMAVRIEDAGFEIRDMIAWVYSTGFPKSHNLDRERGKSVCGCDGSALPYTHESPEPTTERDVRPVRHAHVPQAELAIEERWEVLQPSVQEQGASFTGRSELPSSQVRSSEPGMEGRGDAPEASRELRAGPLQESAGLGRADGALGWLRDGAPTGDVAMVRIPADPKGSGAPRGPRPTEQRAPELGAVAGQSEPQAMGAWPTCRGCGLPRIPRGLGTALKPALEPITVARKPLAGTVAENVMRHGVGGLNIEGCRVPGEKPQVTQGINSNASSFNVAKERRISGDPNEGRWPANLIHDGSEEAAEPLGSAVRFFYCAKASRKDRNEGCEGMEQKMPTAPNGAENAVSANRGSRSGPRENHHPTVKPTDLMRYLCRLVTPPGGVVLDPFTGSGSTGKAAILEGFRFVGIEREAEYIEIARARIEAVMPKPEPAVATEPQLALFP